MPKTIHFEGIPGAGKSTAAERTWTLLQREGIDAYWCLEEDAAHPIMPEHRRAQAHQTNFRKICLDAWSEFVNTSTRTAVLDGYAFQSTIRFFYAHGMRQQNIEDYFRRWQQIGADSSIVYLHVEDTTAHYNNILSLRGDDWANKLFIYVEKTPLGAAKGYSGKAGFIAFWSNYQQLCLELLAETVLPTTIIRCHSFSDADLAALAVTHGLC